MRRKTITLTKGLIFTALYAFSFTVFAQHITVKGTVTDAKGETLTGVTVQVQGTTKGTVTDAQGVFVLQSVASDATLEISYVGMTTVIVQINGRSNVNVVLSDDTELLDELVVVGYGELRRREITGSITNI
jgi:iron complex outermembrane receptor protein